MLALASAAHGGQNPTLILLIIAAAVMVAFWRPLLKFVIAALLVGFVFMLVTSLLDIVHALHKLFS